MGTDEASSTAARFRQHRRRKVRQRSTEAVRGLQRGLPERRGTAEETAGAKETDEEIRVAPACHAVHHPIRPILIWSSILLPYLAA